MRKKLISMSIICTSLTVRTQTSPRFHVEAWLPFRNCERDYFSLDFDTNIPFEVYISNDENAE